MDLIDNMKTLSQKITRIKDTLTTEEATKNALIMPFISMLGYDVFDPTEVVPEYTSDIGTKKGEKVDYAIFKEGAPIMFFECKKCGSDLEVNHASQLYRYFATNSKIRLAVLTNGIHYHFYSDLEESNMMDKKPFLEVNMLDIQEASINELKKLSKQSFNIDNIINSAGEMKYMKETNRVIREQWENPSEEFVKFFVTQIYSGVKTQKVMALFTDIVKRSLSQFINDEINARIKSALNQEPKQDAEKEQEPATDNKISTTQDEIEAYLVVKAISREFVDISRINYKDNMNYFSVQLDDSIRKQYCRFYFNGRQKYIAVFDNPERKEEKLPIELIDDIYKYSDRIKASFETIENKNKDKEVVQES